MNEKSCIEVHTNQISWKWMEHVSTIPLTFTYGAKPESISNVHEYHSIPPVIKTNALNCFKDPLEACVVASSLDRELFLICTSFKSICK